MDARGIDNDPGWINRRFAEIKREIESLRSERRAASTTIAEGGSLLVRGFLRVVGSLDLTGTLSMKSDEGDELVRIGDMQYGRGFELKRDDGSQALAFRKPFDISAVQAWVLLDRQGQVIVAESDLGPGLSRPHLEHPLQPVAPTSGTTLTCGPHGWERQTSSTSWETLYVYDGKAQNPFLDFKFAAFCSDGTTAGEIQVVDLETGNPLLGFFEPAWLGVVPAGSTSYTVVDPPNTRITTPEMSTFGAYIRLGVQVRRTAGSGSITLAVPQSIGG